MIEVKGLTKYYGRTKAVDSATFSVEKGEIFGLLGPNGAGKTTLMRMLTCFLPPSSGTAVVNGHDVLDSPLGAQRSVGYLPERNPLYDDLTVPEFLAFAAEVKGIRGRQQVRRRVAEVMDLCGLSEAGRKTIGKLSKGYRQRVGIAQALVNDPPCLILDEPTIGLDPKQIAEVRRLIKGLSGSRTVILSTHILPEVAMTCDRVIIINEGSIIATDTIEGLTARVRGAAEISLEVEGPVDAVRQAVSAVPGVRSVEVVPPLRERVNRYLVRTDQQADLRKEISSTIVRSGHTLLSIGMREMSLEDIFLKLVTKEEEV